MNMDIEKARAMLASMQPVNEKRDFLEAVKTEIIEAIDRGNSVRQIHRQLKEAGFNGSLMLLNNVVQEWKPKGKRTSKPVKTKTVLGTTEPKTEKTEAEPAAPVQSKAASGGFADKARAYDDDKI